MGLNRVFLEARVKKEFSVMAERGATDEEQLARLGGLFKDLGRLTTGCVQDAELMML